VPTPTPPAEAGSAESDADATEDDEDLDAPLKTHSQRSSQSANKQPAKEILAKPDKAPSPKIDPMPPARPKVQGFRIGGKAGKVGDSPPPNHDAIDTTLDTDDFLMKDPPSSQSNADVPVALKKPKRTFKIGGKGKSGTVSASQNPDEVPPIADRTRETQSPSIQPPSSLPVSRAIKEESPVVEETPEEKAERRRAELKRKTEEAAKKQAQSKKKRRF
jgi:hypothetical protein